MTLLLAFGLPTLLILAYVLGGREWLKRRPWAVGFFAKIEPIEIALWRKSTTILWARFQQLLGVVLTILMGIGTLDLTPLFPLLPEQYKWLPSLLPLIITVVGRVEEWNRVNTTKPIELTEVRDNPSPQVAMAVAAAEISKNEAMQAITTDAAEREVSGFEPTHDR
jgi:hypothetical protein